MSWFPNIQKVDVFDTPQPYLRSVVLGLTNPLLHLPYILWCGLILPILVLMARTCWAIINIVIVIPILGFAGKLGVRE